MTESIVCTICQRRRRVEQTFVVTGRRICVDRRSCKDPALEEKK